MKLTKVKQSHATDEMVADGTIRWQDKDGNEKQRIELPIWVGQGNLNKNLMREDGFEMHQVFLYHIFCELHRFFHCCCTDSCGNNDSKGGSVPDPLVWSGVALAQKATITLYVRDCAWLLAPTLCTKGWQCWPHVPTTPHFVEGLPYSVCSSLGWGKAWS